MSDYTVYVIPRAWKGIRDLPGNVRQRVKGAIDTFADNPCPPESKKLDTPELECDVYRLRLDKWRIVYAVAEAEKVVDVLGVRKRPPYDYGDLGQLLEESSES
ncbi:MAG: type II toxin-antitoxin system RelE family toxin [Planctomycetota bacterium]